MGFIGDEVTSLINELFEKYGQPMIYETQFIIFFRHKGYDRKTMWEILFKAKEMELINIGTAKVDRDKYSICIWRLSELGEVPDKDTLSEKEVLKKED